MATAPFSGGCISPMLSEGCRASLTRVRIGELLTLPILPDVQDR